ncbi:MAG: VRR-NUC domain-containing protein [Bacteroidota bacterium]
MNNQLLKELATSAKNEHELQSYCVQWFNLNYPKSLLFAIPNGGLRNLKVAVKLKKEGVVSGIPDLFLAKGTPDYNGLFIEMKYGKGKTRSNQNEIHTKLLDSNYAVATCWTYEGFTDIVTLYMNNVSINNNNNK